MPFGILECKKMELVPGTACMRDQGDLPDELHDIPVDQLKHGTGRYSHVLLVPQPSDDPNDPLNWPLWKKDMILGIIGLSAAVVGAFGPMIGPGIVTIAEDLGVSVSKVSQSTAWSILSIGLFVFLTNPLAKKYGKRPVYFGAVLILFAASIWAAATKTYDSFLAARVVAGIGMAPYEVMVQSTIGDMYFVHQRGTRIAVWNLFLLAGIAGASLVAGYIIQDMGYRWTFGICGIFFGIFIFSIFFFVPETSYIRQKPRRRPAVASRSSDEKEKAIDTTERVEDVPLDQPIPQKHTFLQSLRIYNGSFSKAPLWKILARPFVMFFYPAVLWAFLLYGTTFTWIVVFSVVNGVIFVKPPYSFSVSEVGLTGLSPFILTIIGECISGPLNDWICVKLAKRNHGIYESEFRLVPMIIVVILGTVGFFGFGATVQFQTHWTGPVLTYGLANMSVAFMGTCVFGYLLDSYPKLAEEAFVAINARNLLTFGLTYFVNNWLDKDGPLKVFNVLGGLFLAVCALTIPLWVFGKKIRSAVARNQWLNDFMTDV